MEKWDIYDLDRNKTGRILIRGTQLQKGEYHLVVHCCIFNDKGEMLIQHRQKDKKVFPDKWDMTAGGSVLAGENSREGVHRELFEEIGLDIDFSKIHPKITANFSEGFDDIYIINRNVDISTLKFQPEEVQDAKWASIEEVLDMIDKGEFVPYKKEYIRYCYELRNGGITLNE